MTHIERSKSYPNYRLPIILAVIFAVSYVANASEPASSADRFHKCWEIPTAVLSEQGLSADEANTYFVTRDGKVTAVELVTGKIAWTAEVGGTPNSELVLAKDKIFTIASPVRASPAAKPVLRAFTSTTGLPLWNVELPTSRKYFLTSDGEQLAAVSSEGALWLFSADAGQIKWTASTNGLVSAQPRIEDGRLLIAVDGKRVQEFSMDSGVRVAVAEVDGDAAFVGAGRSSAAVYSDDRGNVHSIQMGGGRNWNFRAGGRVVYIRAVADNVLFGSADNFVYFMSVERGNLLWKRRLPGRIASGGLIGADLAVFTVVGDRSAYIVELDKGRLIDRLELADEDAFLVTSIRANGEYVVAASANGLTAFSTGCGKQKSGKQLPLSGS